MKRLLLAAALAVTLVVPAQATDYDRVRTHYAILTYDHTCNPGTVSQEVKTLIMHRLGDFSQSTKERAQAALLRDVIKYGPDRLCSMFERVIALQLNELNSALINSAIPE